MRYKLFALSAVLLLPFLFGESYHVYAPELFGEGTMYVIGGQGYIDAWGGWIIYGTADACTIVQIAGARIEDAGQPIPCHRNHKKDWFNGWIDFRGHPRKFCGAARVEDIPRKCFGD